MKVPVEKLCYMIFGKKTKYEINLDPKIYGHNLNHEEKVKLSGIKIFKYQLIVRLDLWVYI
ncbi:hypothetical protein BpHYR1_004870 [Brachionus plicatilis]|uniref:Uncharacterized protein n=1 Tax=Brachionus plicatilis TaxID=10195 RepID=A0A3M7PMX3_BRAPC|nr:hypothetical protein BpHYR1_004870 [Brachionus plicatilis]